MTKMEELELLLQIMQKHDLPMSPILEYAINEKYKCYTDDCSISSKNEMPVMNNNGKADISYIELFSNLSTGIKNGRKLPHKAVLLLSILELVGSGTIKENRFELSKTIANCFATTWDSYLSGAKIPSVWIPFWYMKSEPFWHFKASSDENELQNLLSFAGHPTVGQMRNVIKYAYVDEQLFVLLQNKQVCSTLANTLVETYLR